MFELIWVLNKKDNFNCEILKVGKISVARYTRSLIRDDPDEEYKAVQYLPFITPEKISGGREYVKNEIELSVKAWIELLSEKNNGGNK